MEQPLSTGPSVYKYPCDGSLLMPEIPDEEEKQTTPLLQSAIQNNLKRSASVSRDSEPEIDSNKRIKK